MRGLVSDFDQFSAKNPELPSHIAIQLVRKNLEFTENLKISRLKESLTKTAFKNNFNDEDLKKLENICTSLDKYQNKKINYVECRNEIVEVMNTMENPEAGQIFHKSRDVLKGIMMERFCLSAQNAKELSPEERINIFLSKTFTNSVRDIMYMKSKSEKYDNEPVATCSGCKKTRTSIIDPVMSANKSMENIAKYFDDIYSSPLLDKDLQDHTIKVKYAAQMISKGAVNTTKLTSARFEKVKNDLHNSEIMKHNFELVNEEGIPCASCGITMLTYDQKEKIRVEIDNTKDIFELQKIIHKYSDHIKPLYQKAYAMFDKFLEENPNITDDEMMASLRKYYDNKLTNGFNKISEMATEYMNDPNISTSDQAIFADYLAKAKDDYSNITEIIKVDDYFPIFDSTIAHLQNKEVRSNFYDVKGEIWENSMLQSLTCPPNNFTRNKSSKLKDMVNYTIARASASVDHMVAKSKGGENDTHNLMILCNDCNKHKKNKNFYYWIGKDPDIHKNMQKYLDAVTDKIYKKGMKQYYGYPHRFAEQVRNLTQGTYTLTLSEKKSK